MNSRQVWLMTGVFENHSTECTACSSLKLAHSSFPNSCRMNVSAFFSIAVVSILLPKSLIRFRSVLYEKMDVLAATLLVVSHPVTAWMAGRHSISKGSSSLLSKWRGTIFRVDLLPPILTKSSFISGNVSCW